MRFVRTKKGYPIKVAGSPSKALVKQPRPSCVGMTPYSIPFVKPRLLVEVGSHVNVGSPLFEDKRYPAVRFLSPGGGKIESIHFGPRRVITAIVIKLDAREGYEQFEVFKADDLETVGRDRLARHLMTGGIWPMLRELPFRDIASQDKPPPAIIVSLDSKEPFQPDPEVYLDGKHDLFKLGVRALKKLAADDVRIATSRENRQVLKALEGVVTHVYTGHFPVDDPGVLLYRTKKSPLENRSWFINGQDVMLLGQFLATGIYPVDRTIVLAGSATKEAMHVSTRTGVPLAHLADGRKAQENIRAVVGGIFRGYTGLMDSFMGYYENSLILIPEETEAELLAFVRPGFLKPSYSRTFFSVFNPGPFVVDSGIHGGERACIGCGYCADVCPVDILPQLAFKSLLAEDLLESLSHGLLDCVECGLCSYVCPSKIELFSTFRKAKDAFYKEQMNTN